MADEHNDVLGWLVMVLHLLTGVSGGTVLFTTVGGDVSLPCSNVVYPNCSSTDWNYYRPGLQGGVEEVGHGKINTNSQRAGKLKVGSNCSLHVSDVTVQDAGLYRCQQFLIEGKPQYGGDADVYLSVLTIFSSPPVTDIKSDTPVTLRCSLYTYAGPGRCSPVVKKDVSLLWVDEGGNDLQTDSRYQVTQTSDCDNTLTVTLQREDNNRKWTCLLIYNGTKETSTDFTFMAPGSTSSTAGQDMSDTSLSAIGTCYDAELPISRIMLFATLTIMVAIVMIKTTMTIQPHKSLKPQADNIETSGIELQLFVE